MTLRWRHPSCLLRRLAAGKYLLKQQAHLFSAKFDSWEHRHCKRNDAANDKWVYRACWWVATENSLGCKSSCFKRSVSLCHTSTHILRTINQKSWNNWSSMFHWNWNTRIAPRATKQWMEPLAGCAEWWNCKTIYLHTQEMESEQN